MKITQEQFNNEVAKLKNTNLDKGVKNAMKAKLMAHVDSYNPPVRSPYHFSFHFSYKIVSSAIALVLFVSIGTTYASQTSLPGEALYTIKTNIAEPILKLTKITQKEKEDFDLSLADKRIQEVERLIKEDKVTEANINENFALFEKHLEENKKENKEKNKKEGSKSIEKINTNVEVKNFDNINNESDEENNAKINKRVERYRNLIISKPDLNNFYENKAKSKLEQKEKNEQLEEVTSFKEKEEKELENTTEED